MEQLTNVKKSLQAVYDKLVENQNMKISDWLEQNQSDIFTAKERGAQIVGNRWLVNENGVPVIGFDTSTAMWYDVVHEGKIQFQKQKNKLVNTYSPVITQKHIRETVELEAFNAIRNKTIKLVDADSWIDTKVRSHKKYVKLNSYPDEETALNSTAGLTAVQKLQLTVEEIESHIA